MTSLELDKKWSEIGHTGGAGFRSIKIAADCKCDLFIGIDSDSNRCLILSVGLSSGVEMRDEVKDHIGIKFYDESGHVVITLVHNEYQHLFNDLILSLYSDLKNIGNNKLAAKEMLKGFRTWCEFFSNSSGGKLTKEEIQGLYGELFYLKRLVIDSVQANVNDILKSWTGPLDKGQDFIFSDKNVEIKTKDSSSIEVNISSEFQLQREMGKGLELHVISVESYSSRGQTLKELWYELREKINDKQGDLSIVVKLLSKKLQIDQLPNYDEWKFTPRSEVTYNCILDAFPLISSTSIPQQIRKVRYALKLVDLESYVINSIDY